MKTLNSANGLLFCPVFILLNCLSADAQKLPEIQKKSVYAPANIQVDGKTTEWANKFEAYNNATQIFYTLANDDQNLYLVVQATRPQMVQKTMISGINLVVNNTADKNDKQRVAITFPTMARPRISKNTAHSFTGPRWSYLCGDRTYTRYCPESPPIRHFDATGK